MNHMQSMETGREDRTVLDGRMQDSIKRVQASFLPSRYRGKLCRDLEVLFRSRLYLSGLSRIVLFGSCARNEMRAGSDLDLLVLTEEAGAPGTERRVVWRTGRSAGWHFDGSGFLYGRPVSCFGLPTGAEYPKRWTNPMGRRSMHKLNSYYGMAENDYLYAKAGMETLQTAGQLQCGGRPAAPRQRKSI